MKTKLSNPPPSLCGNLSDVFYNYFKLGKVYESVLFIDDPITEVRFSVQKNYLILSDLPDWYIALDDKHCTLCNGKPIFTQQDICAVNCDTATGKSAFGGRSETPLSNDSSLDESTKIKQTQIRF